MNATPIAQPDPEPHKLTLGDFLPCLWLTLLAAAFLPLPAAYGWINSGMTGVQAAVLAAGICLFSAFAALLLAIVAQGSPMMLHATLAGIFLRTGFPLICGLLLHWKGGPLVEAGMFGMILACYLVMLAGETILAVLIISKSPTYKRAI
ncbi:MAG: hypothetical protein WD045_08745 [Pirellulaceae bacterium]